MTRIVHVITGLPIGGAQMMLWKLLSRTNHSEFQTEIVSLLDRGMMAERFEALGIPVHTLGMRLNTAAPLAIARLSRWLRARPVHILQTWMYHADFVGGLAGRWAGLENVLWGIRQSDPHNTKWSTRAAAWGCARLSRSIPKRVICCSKAARHAHAAFGYAPEKMLVIPNGFDLDEFRPDALARRDVRRELGLDNDTPLVGLIGRFDKQKDHRTFVWAAAAVQRQNPATRFLLCGPGVTPENPKLSAWISACGIGDHCSLLGERRDVQRLTAALDVAVSSSFGEGFPNVVGEAMACGVPCVVTNVGDSREIVGDTGIVVPAKNPEALAAGITRLLKADTTKRCQLGEAAHLRIATHYDLRGVVNCYEELWRELRETS